MQQSPSQVYEEPFKLVFYNTLRFNSVLRKGMCIIYVCSSMRQPRQEPSAPWMSSLSNYNFCAHIVH